MPLDLILIDRPTSECRYCGKPIAEAIGTWWHWGSDGGAWRGCRAASFVKDVGWNDDLDPKWKATPALVTKSGKVLTDQDIEALADEAEAGYDVEHLKGKPSRRRT